MEMSLFKHRDLSLNKKEIRLLKLRLGTEEEAAPIHLTIRHAVLDVDLEYNALSYAWGDASPTQNIAIDDENGKNGFFPVRQNLYDFLDAARRLDESWTTEWIWIDQICINQTNHEERCHQVSQMTDLYTCAKATVVWPGLVPAFEEPRELSGPDFDSAYKLSMHDWEYQDLKVNERLLGRITRSWLPVMLAQPYWFRLWIVQEIALASRVLVFLTTATYSLNDVRDTLDVIPRLASEYEWDIDEDDRINTLTRKLQSMQNLHDQLSSSPLDVHWTDVLRETRGTIFTEPLDRMYAVMGLVTASVRFQPDYTLSRKELLQIVARQEIKFLETSNHIDRSLYNRLRDLLRCIEFPFFDCHPEIQDTIILNWETDHSKVYLSMCRILDVIDIPVPSSLALEFSSRPAEDSH